MRVSKAIALGIVLAAPSLVSVSSAQAASECPVAGILSTWGINSTGVFNVASGGACLFPLRIEGVIASSSVMQKPAYGVWYNSTNPLSSIRQTPGTKAPIPFPFRRQVEGPRLPARQ